MQRLKSGQNLFIFYFYLRRKLTRIKEEIIDIQEKTRRDRKFRLLQLLENIGIAAAITLLIYYSVVFVYLGMLRWPTRADWIQMGLEFVFLLFLFWSHRQIAQAFNKKFFKQIHPVIKGGLEMAAVILSAILLHYLINYVPISIIYSEADFNPVNVRNGYVIGVIVALFFYYFVEMRKRERQLQAEKLRSARLQKENFQAQLESLKQQVNPHFLFNSLNVLGSLVYSDQDKAVDFIRKLSDLYRSYLDNSAESLVPLKKELEMAHAYTYLLETRFGNAIGFEFDIANESLPLSLPPGSLQMLIENAVKHNGSTTSKPLLVKIKAAGENLVVTNRLQPRKEKMVSTKTGLENIKNRYRYLTDEELEFKKTKTEFIAKLPLLKVEFHEGSDH